MSSVAFLGPRDAPKSLAGGASPQTSLEELTALPRPAAGFKGPTSEGRGADGRGRKGREGEEAPT